MNTLLCSLDKNLNALKKILPSEDILTYAFQTADNINCALVYADGMVNKDLLGDLVARPLSKLILAEKTQNEGGRYALNDKSGENSTKNTPVENVKKQIESIEKTLLFPELKQKRLLG